MKNASDEHTHSDSMTTYTYRSEFAFDTRILDSFFQNLPYDIYRVKGFVHLKEKPGMRYILQKAGARVTLTLDNEWK